MASHGVLQAFYLSVCWPSTGIPPGRRDGYPWCAVLALFLANGTQKTGLPFLHIIWYASSVFSSDIPRGVVSSSSLARCRNCGKSEIEPVALSCYWLILFTAHVASDLKCMAEECELTSCCRGLQALPIRDVLATPRKASPLCLQRKLIRAILAICGKTRSLGLWDFPEYSRKRDEPVKPPVKTEDALLVSQKSGQNRPKKRILLFWRFLSMLRSL
jgi:hypothetical protein